MDHSIDNLSCLSYLASVPDTPNHPLKYSMHYVAQQVTDVQN